MAASFRVKEISAWKTVEIPQDLLNAQDFDSLVEITELTDYELVPFDSGRISKVSGSSKKKRKSQNLEDTTQPHSENSPPLLKKQKIPKTECGCENTVHNDNPAIKGTTQDNKGQKLGNATTKKSKKNNTISSHNNKNIDNEDNLDIENTHHIVNKSNISETHAESKDVSEKNSVSETKKRKRKKKKLKRAGGNPATTNTDVDSTSKKQTANNNEDDIKSIRKKKKKRKKKRAQQSVQETHTQMETAEDEEGDNSSDDDIKEKTSSKKMKVEPDMPEWKNLYVPDVLLQALQDQGFDSPTPIQSMALPSAVRDRKDILAAAETGSGKTLAFGIPVFARILSSGRLDTIEKEYDDDDTNEEQHPPLALILEPTRELAVQVKKHLTALAQYTDIKIATVVGGMSIEKQRRILGKKPHVVIATPGRLWQLIEEGNEHLRQVDKVLCLVVDEADRMIEKGHYEELTKLFEMMNKSSRRVKNRQTFVMSATLTMEVTAPKRVVNKLKKKMVSEDKLKTLTERICVGQKPKVIDLTPKDKVAQTLTELRVNCKADEKDFYLYYFLCRHPGRTLVFANSKDCLRRLVSLFTLLQCSPLPLHADMQQRQRLKNLDKFAANSRSVLVASDVAARGLDIPNVDHVIHYQVPRTMENYVHRSGRTARASKLGLSVMLIGPEDARDYRKIVYGVRNGEELPIMPVAMELFPAVKQRVALARDIDVREYRMKKKRLRNNFFTKAAEEMDMILDDTNLLEDMGDAVEQAEERRQLQQKRTQLTSLMRLPLMPQHMTKYPTKSGQLLSEKVINLHKL